MAFETLRLRAAHRELLRVQGPKGESWPLWDHIVGSTPWPETFAALEHAADAAIALACRAARDEAWHCELGPENRREVAGTVRSRLRSLTGRREIPRNLVLIGGPPCQAYSMVGRSRNRGTAGYRAEGDHRHYLYREYLNVIREFKPAVFIMENVKGLLSSTVLGQDMFTRIRSDLARPDIALGDDVGLEYYLVSLSQDSLFQTLPASEDFIVESEKHGVPQSRHRLVICGMRKDVFQRAGSTPAPLPLSRAPTVAEAISDLPRLHPRLSFRGKGLELSTCFDNKFFLGAVDQLRQSNAAGGAAVAARMESAAAAIRMEEVTGSGAERLVLPARRSRSTGVLNGWCIDRQSSVLANHEARAHMPDDLVRYLFVSSYGQVHGQSPKLRHFPRSLLPVHANINPDDIGSAIFNDRFRVQVADLPATTITSHIGKDGHAFIHYDPEQCRSLTVREAARLQTFPDSYVFLGNRTSQYTQVGNAVPPLLAARIADAVGTVLRQAILA